MPVEKSKVVNFYDTDVEKRNTEVLRRFQQEVINKQNYDMKLLRQFVKDDVIDHGIPRPGVIDCHAPFGEYTGVEGLQKRFETFSSSFGDAQEEDTYSMADGDYVAMRYVLRGHHTGDFMGLGATNGYFAMNGVEMIRFKD